MKIAIRRNDGKIFCVDGKLAEDIRDFYRQQKISTVVEVDGESFKIRDIKDITDLEYKNEIGKSKTCGVCRDGWMETSKNGKWEGHPGNFGMTACDCPLGSPINIFIEEYKLKLLRR